MPEAPGTSKIAALVRRSLLLAFLLALAAALPAAAQVDVTATAGTLNASYTTLKGAFDAINAGTHQGVIGIGISGNTTETAPAVINASGAGAAVYTSILIQPTGGAGRTISGAIAAGSPLIDFNGADNVTIDGLNTGGNSLTIANTTASATSGTATLRFIGGATNNVVTNSSIQGSSSASVATNGGTIFFSTDAVTTGGNDNNTISNNNIGPAGANLPSKAILCNGSTTTTALGNSGNVVTNNNVFDYFGAAVTSSGIAANGGCNNNSITNNRLFQTATRTWTTGALHSGINIQNATATSGAQGYTISGNIIGFASNTQTGAYTLTGAGTGAKFVGILFNGISTGTTTNVNNNTVAAVSMTGVTGAGTTTNSPFTAILLQEGNLISNGNTIGSQSATGSLTFSTTTTSAADVYGLFNFTSNAWTANNNTVGGMAVTNLGASGTFLLMGIRAFTGTTVAWTSTGNTVGGTVANSIQLTATGVGSQVLGIFTSNAPATLTSNTVRNLTSNIGTGTTTTASVIGISITTATPSHTVSQNTIFNLTNTNATAASVVTGLQFNGATANLVARNSIYGLSVATNSTAAEINGIRIAGGTTTYRNNMIAIGAGTSNAIGTGSTTGGINGIFEASGTNAIVHNSVYIGGAPTAGVGPSYAFASTQVTVTRSVRDNIFFNARANAGATGKNYVIRVAGTGPNPPGLTLNNNVELANGAGAVFGFFNSLDVADLNAWKVATGQDAVSFSLDPQYLAPTAATPDLHIHPTNLTPIEANGADVGVTDDFDGQVRASFTPVDIGADAGNFNGADLSPPAISYTPFSNTSQTTNRTLTVTLTDVTGVATGGLAPRIYYRKNAGTYFSQACTLATGTVQNGTWNCLINNADLGGVAISDVIGYFVVAQDTLGNLASSPPGVVATDVNTVTTPPTPNTYTILASVSGPIAVGTAETFTSLTNAGGVFEALNNRVFTGDVVISLTSDLTTETGLNALNKFAEDGVGGYTLTIRPTGAARTISGSANTALIRMNGASRVTIDGSIDSLGNDRSLSITNTSVTSPSVVLFGSVGSTPVTNDTLKNTIITNGVNTSSAVVISDATVLGNAGFFSNIVIQNNDIRKAFVGVFATGGTSPQGGSNVTYTQNTLNSTGANAIRDVGLYLQGVNGATVSQNTVANIDKVNDENDVGIWLATGTINATVSGNSVSAIGYTGTGAFGAIGINVTSGGVATNLVSSNTIIDISTNGGSTGSLARGIAVAGATSDVTIEKNRIQDIINTSTGTFPAYGIDIAGGNNFVVRNNFVSNVSFNMTGGSAFSTQFGVFGIRVASGTGHKIYNNSVNLFGPLAGTAAASLLTAAFGLVGTTSTDCDVRDNIFANNITGGTTSIAHVAVYLPAGGTSAMNLTFNNNAYFFGTDVARQGVGQAGTTAGTNFFTTLPAQLAYTSTLSGAGTNDNASQASTGAVPFVSNSDLHLTPGSPLATAGVPLAGVTVDIDNQPRSLTTPAIGADEQVADLSILKDDGVAATVRGATVTYTIVAGNAGPAATTGTVTDTFPADLTGCSWTCVGAGGGTCTAGPTAGNINDPVSLPVGASLVYTATCTVSQSAGASLANTATVAGVAGDPNPANNSATDTDTVSSSADLAITKTDGVTVAAPGGSVTYTITASNAGPSNTTATVADTFPASLTCSWTCVGAGGGTCSAGPTAGNISDGVTLPAGGSVTYTASCTISAAATGTLANTATVAGAAGDPNSGNNSATDSDTLTASANLAITKTDGVTVATPGGSVTYTITASNAGPSNTTATVADTFPASLTCNWTCVGAGGGTCTAAGSGNINNTGVGLPVGGSVTYTASCTISAAATGTLSNTATVTGAAGDPNSGNNSATDSDTLTASANLAITKTDGVTTATPGGSTTYTIVASNAGPSNTTATVADTFPATLTCNWTCVGAGGATCTAAGSGNINNTGVGLPVGGTATYTAVCAISAAATGNLSNTATVTGAAGDPNNGNNSATDVDSLAAAADILIAKTVNNATPTTGSNVVFTITATNNGPSNASGVEVDDLLPAGLGFVSATPSQGSYSNVTGIWTVGALANGASATLSLTALVNRSESQVNVASVGVSDQIDPRASNNTAAVRLNGAALIDIQVGQTVDNAAPTIGQNVTFTVTARNAGPSTANAVSLTANLPAGLNHVSNTPSQGTYTPASGIWNVGTLASGATATLTVVMQNTLSSPIVRTVTKTMSTEEDLVTGNDAATVVLNPAGAQVDVALTKISTQEPVPASTNFNYVVVVTNLGSSDATGVTMTDTLPAGVTLVTATPSQGSCGAPAVTCSLGTIPAGGTVTIDIVVTKTVGGPVTNTASVTANESDPNTSNNTNMSTTTPVELSGFSVD